MNAPSVTAALPDVLARIPAGAAYAVIAAAVLAEAVLLVGAFVPTLTLMLTAGALARAGHLHLFLVVGTAAAAVVTGDFLAHRAGGALGARLRTTAVGRRVPAAAWRRAEELTGRRGGQAVLVGRFLPVIRTLTPYLAGAARLPYRGIAPYSAFAAPVWAAAEAGAGYAAAPSLQHVLALGAPALAGLLAAAGGVLFCVRVRARARGRVRAQARTRRPNCPSEKAGSPREAVGATSRPVGRPAA